MDKSDRSAELCFLESLERIDREIRRSQDLQALLPNLMQAALEIFGCDRAWLLYPCDPDAPSFRIPMEASRPGYPGAFELDLEVPMYEGAAEVCAVGLTEDGPVDFGPDAARPIYPELTEQFGVLSQMVLAIHPRIGRAWLFGMHQCSHARAWSEEDKNLFQEIGRRVGDGLTSALILRDLRDSEQRYRSLVDNLPGAVYRCANDTHWTMHFISDAIEKISGYPTADFIENRVRSYASIIHEDDRGAVTESVQAALEAGEPFVMEYRIVHASGEIRWVYEQGRGVLDDDGEVRFLDGVILDVTERRLAEAERERLGAILEATSDMVSIASPDARISYMNRAGKEMLGWDDAGLEAERRISDAHPEWAFRRILDDGIPAAMDRGTWTGETAFLRPDGGEIPVSQVIMSHRSSSGEVEYLSTIARDISNLKRAEEALRASEEKYRILFERSADAILIIDGDQFVDCNDATVRMLRYDSKDELLQTHPSELSPERQPDGRLSYEKANEMMRIAFERGSHRFEWDHRRADGEVLPVEALLTSIPVGKRKILHVVWRDISDRRRTEEEKEKLEAQLRQSQKMEAFGQLAGGVAHDFNNILTAILGNVELAIGHLERGLLDDGPLRHSLAQIKRSSERASALTRQLLAFSRRQVSQPKVLDLNRVLHDMESMLRRLLTEDIRLETVLAEDLEPVLADTGQIEQVVLNLAVNARDAMRNGGVLVLRTCNRTLDADSANAHPEANPGPHVVLSVEDSGIGMDAGIAERVFEPFFTTKGVGQGTGLGLATVYGIVRQAGGHVAVHSEPGEGSTFEVLLPAADAKADSTCLGSDEPTPSRGTETILVCEDDDSVRKLAASFLRGAGYTVLAAADGKQALGVAGAHAYPIHLLVTDVIMPDMNGRELAEQLSAVRRDVKILYVSGYTADVIAHHGVLDEGVDFLEKPFGRDALLERVRSILDR